MLSLHNIEKSAFRRGEYVGYGNGVWRVARASSYTWRAVRLDGRPGAPVYRERTLAALSRRLADYAAAVKPEA